MQHCSYFGGGSLSEFGAVAINGGKVYFTGRDLEGRF
jgi:hypothetical protein